MESSERPLRGPFPFEEYPMTGEAVRTMNGHVGVVVQTRIEGRAVVSYVKLAGETSPEPYAPFTLSLEVED